MDEYTETVAATNGTYTNNLSDYSPEYTEGIGGSINLSSSVYANSDIITYIGTGASGKGGNGEMAIINKIMGLLVLLVQLVISLYLCIIYRINSFD